MTTRVPLLFGTMTFGYAGKNGVRTSSLEGCQAILDVFFKHGHKEIDTARLYAEGTTEDLLSQLDLSDATIDTKVYPVKPGDHSPERLRATFLTSLEQLKRPKVRVLYLHAPDRSVPFEDTVREVNKLYEEGKFETFGLSNYASWEVAEIVGICRANRWVQPKIYQVMYNAITREMEEELLPCARKFGLRLVIYNPLGGGLLAGKVTSISDQVEAGSRFDPKAGWMGTMYRDRYLRIGFLEAVKLIQTVADKHKLTMAEIAFRWCQHHSALAPEDGIILGASSPAQLEQNILDNAKGPLPDDVVQTLDEAQRLVVQHGSAPLYWR